MRKIRYLMLTTVVACATIVVPALPVSAVVDSIAYWYTMPGTTARQYYTGETSTTPYEGVSFGYISATQPGASIYQDRTYYAGVGDTLCANAQVVTHGASAGSITFAVFLLGGAVESSSKTISSLAGDNGWTPITVCITSTQSAHNAIRTQFYPGVNGPAVGVDAVDLHVSNAPNGGFNNGASYWTASPGTNLSTYGPGVTGNNPYEGGGFASATAGGSIYQEFTLGASSAEEYCASAQVASFGNTVGAGGSIAISLISTNAFPWPLIAKSTRNFSALPGGDNWTSQHVCAESPRPYNKVKIEVIPQPGTPTLVVDVVDLHPVLLTQSGFNTNTNFWRTHSPTALITSTSNAYEGGQSSATSPGGSTYQDLQLPGPTSEICVSVRAAQYGTIPGAITMAIWQLGQASMSASKMSYLGANWAPLRVCYSQNSGYLQRVEFYIHTGQASLDVVDAHRSMITNGGMYLQRIG